METMVQGKLTVTDKEIVEWMSEQTDPAFTTAEVADEFDMSDEGMRNRLRSLAVEGRIECKKPTPQNVIWWVESGQSLPVRSA
jgi:response regulator of citrate/malate metabolism